MAEDATTLSEAERDKIGREHLAKALTKEIPLVGNVIAEMVFETAKSEASAQDKAKLYGLLNELKSNQGAADTDLGDILRKLEAQKFEMQELRAAITAFAAYLQGQATAGTVKQVEIAAERALPGYRAGATHSDVIGTLDRSTLRKAMEKGLTPVQLNTVISETPGANDYVSFNTGKDQRITELLDWAESITGPGLNGLFTYIKRQYDSFTLHP